MNDECGSGYGEDFQRNTEGQALVGVILYVTVVCLVLQSTVGRRNHATTNLKPRFTNCLSNVNCVRSTMAALSTFEAHCDHAVKTHCQHSALLLHSLKSGYISID
jgi:hypothetical protein